MLAAQRTGNAILLFAVDLAILGVAFFAAYFLRFGSLEMLDIPGRHQTDHIILGTTMLSTWLGALLAFGHYRLDAFATRRFLLPQIAALAVIVGVAVAAVIFFSQAKLASRQVFAFALAAQAGGIWLVRAVTVIVRSRASKRRGIKIAIVGSGDLALDLGSYVESHPQLGYQLAGYVTRGSEPSDAAGQSVLGHERDIGNILEHTVVDQVIIAAPITELGGFENLIQECEEVGVNVSVAAVGLSPRIANVSISELGQTPLLQLATSPQFRAAMVGKRVFDFIFAAILIVLAAPLITLAALAVKLTSRGPIFFVQDRVGLNGRIFPFLKFRTMVDGAHALRDDLESEVGPIVFKMRNDPRITAIGSFLRRFSIDELPQLINVLRGEMSLVGPRPPLPEEVAQYDRWQRRRLSVRPGITCTWQVSGRSEIGFNEWMRLDLAYIDNWSPWLDLKILARTIPAVLSRRGAA